MPANLSIGVLSYRAHATLRHTLDSHLRAGLPNVADEYFVFFNALCDEDREIASSRHLTFCGSAENSGIFGGFREIAGRAKSRYVLILENDICAILPKADAAAQLKSALDDMERHEIPVFSLRSRLSPGQGLSGAKKYVRAFGVSEHLRDEYPNQRAGSLSKLMTLLEYGSIDKFRGRAIFVERHPEVVQPSAIRLLPSGNFVSDSRYLNWSNQSVLVRRDFFLDFICPRVESHPDPRLVNGFQDIERALNRRWWRRQRVPMGQAGRGIFTHHRLEAGPR
jgi:hypothetical protein